MRSSLALLLGMALLLAGCGRAIEAARTPPASAPNAAQARTSDARVAVLQVSHARHPSDVAFAGRAPRLAVGSGDGRVDLWDTSSWTLLRTIETAPRNEPESIGTGNPSLALSPDGATLAVAVAGNDVQLWDARFGTRRFTLPVRSDYPLGLAFSPDGARLGIGSQPAALYDVATGHLVRSLSGQSTVAFSADGKLLATGDDTTVSLYRADTGAKIRTLKDKSGVFGPVAFSPDGRLVATAGEDPSWEPGPLPEDEEGNVIAPTEAYYAHMLKVKLWDARTGKRLRMLPGHASTYGGTSVLQFTPDGKRLFSGGDGYSALWDVSTGKSVREFDNLGPTAMSGDGRLVIVYRASIDGSGLRIYSARTGKRVAALHEPPKAVTALAFSKDGTTLAAGEPLGLRLWDVRSNRLARALAGPPAGSDRPLAGFLPDGSAYESNLNGTTIWDPATGRRKRTLQGPLVKDPDDGTESHAWQLLAPDGQTTVNEAGGAFHTAFQVRDAATGRMRSVIMLGLAPPFRSAAILILSDAAFSPDGRYLAFTTDRMTNPPSMGFATWDLRTGEKVSEVPDIGLSGLFLSFSPDGKTLAGALPSPMQMPAGVYVTGHRLVLWDVATGKEKRRITLDQPAGTLAFSPDGQTLALGMGDPNLPRNASPDAVRLYDAATLKEAGHLAGGEAPVRSVAFSPDGTRLATGDAEGFVRLYDRVSGKLLETFLGFPSANGARFSADWLAFRPDGSADGSPGGLRLLRWRVDGRLLPGVGP